MALVTQLQVPTVDTLVKHLVAGTMTLDAVAAEFSHRDWSFPPMTMLEQLGGADVPLPANDWEPVETAHQRGELTDEQYELLKKARGPIRRH